MPILVVKSVLLMLGLLNLWLCLRSPNQRHKLDTGLVGGACLSLALLLPS